MSTPRTLRYGDGVRRITLETSRGRFAALEALPGTGVCRRQPALLVPGYTGSKEDFLPVLTPLASAGRRVVAIDMRGQYESPAAPDVTGYGLPSLAADLAVVAGTLGGRERSCGSWRKVHLLGHSFGGLVVRELALAKEAMIGSLTLMSSGPGTLTGPRAATLEWLLTGLRTIPAGDLAGEIERMWETQLGPQAVADGAPGEVVTFLRTRMLSNCPVGLRAMAEILLACPDRTAALSRLRPAPMLVIYGENDDAWAPAIQRDMAERLGAHRVCIPRAAHSPAVEVPETVVGALTAFWNAVESKRVPALSTSRGPGTPGRAGAQRPWFRR